MGLIATNQLPLQHIPHAHTNSEKPRLHAVCYRPSRYIKKRQLQLTYYYPLQPRHPLQRRPREVLASEPARSEVLASGPAQSGTQLSSPLYGDACKSLTACSEGASLLRSQYVLLEDLSTRSNIYSGEDPAVRHLPSQLPGTRCMRCTVRCTCLFF